MKTSESIKHASLGSISWGTLRSQDLVSKFMTELEWQIHCSGAFFALPENHRMRDRLASLVSEAQDAFDEDGDNMKPEVEENASELIDELIDALNEFAPPFCYFGTHEADGADFGYWASRDSIDELPTVADSDAAKAFEDDCKVVNDHGNVTVYSDGKVVLELV